MAPRRARAGPAVDYRETSSEEDHVGVDESFEESEDTSPPPRTVRPKRKRSPGPSRRQVATRTRRQPRQSYAEDFSEDDASEFSEGDPMDVDEDVLDEVRSPKLKRAKIVRANTKRANHPPRKALPKREPAARSPSPLRNRRETNVSRPIKQPVPWVDERHPPWSTLPFEILRTIFACASFPLFDEKGVATLNGAWLVKTSRVCRAFLEPALTALYNCPPITTSVRAHELLAMLSQTSTDRAINYNTKPKHLELEARSTLAYSAGVDYGSVDLGSLVKQLPQLSGIDIWSIYDIPEFRRAVNTKRSWSYPDSLFDALVQRGNRLRNFHWNEFFLTKLASKPAILYEWMHGIHLMAPFQTLQYLKLTSFLGDSEDRIDLQFPVNFSSPMKPLTPALQTKEALRLEKKQSLRKDDELLANALSVLSNLRKLDLHSCSIVDGEWLQFLPTNLTDLGISECDMLDSEGLQDFLKSHGSHLKALALDHNIHLNIAFLTTLRSSCPVLEYFEMDLKYYRKSATIKEDPAYESLLLPDERPTWPSTLQCIEMHYLRQWSSSAAETFFNSLIDSAEELLHLRTLIFTVSLDISWRERARMRDQWEDRFRRVFLRKSPDPNPQWMSIRQFKDWKEKQNTEVVVDVDMDMASRDLTETSHAPTEDDDFPIARRRTRHENGITRRLRPRKAASDADERSASDAGPSSSLRDMVMEAMESHVQGMCNVVDVRIDNLRPRETQLNEGDFLDSEPSGDEEWDENRGDLDDEELYVRRKGKGKGSRSRYAW